MVAAQAEDDPYVEAALRLFLLTGLRKRELLSARWSNVDLERGEIRLPNTKSGEPQTRTLTTDAVEVLKGMPHMKESVWVFLSHPLSSRQATPSQIWISRSPSDRERRQVHFAVLQQVAQQLLKMAA